MKRTDQILFRKLSFFIAAIFMVSATWAQQSTITGKVIDDSGEALPGVAIVVEGTSIGTVTNVDGNYSLSIPSNATSLNFSFVGMKLHPEIIKGRTLINVTMESESIGLDEVVAIGYGSVKKADLTGSVTGINADDIENQPVTRLESALQGRVAGVSINKISGTPGGDMKIRIRGVNSISGGNNPLIVVDGFAGGDLNTLNPGDIQSIDILKDASATAIYGSRGANGVIIVTTKKAKIGAPSVKFHSFASISQVAKTMDLINAGEWAELSNKQDTDLGRPLYYTDAEVQQFYQDGGTDFQDEIFRTGISQNYELSMSGGSKTFNYYVSGNVVDETGILINSDYKRYGLRANLEAKPSEKVTFGLNMYVAHEDEHNVNNNGGGSVQAAMAYAPVFPVYSEALGDYSADLEVISTNAANPVFLANEKNNDLNNNILNALGFLKFDLTDQLTFSINGGVRMLNLQRFVFNRHLPGQNVASANANTTNTYRLNWQNYYNLTYKNTVGIHNITASAIYEMSSSSTKGMSGSALGFPTVSLGYNDLGLASTQFTDTNFGKSALQSFLGRVNYTIANKYLLTATFRADGSSKFAEENKYSYFPSAAAAWRLMEEGFIQDMGVFDNLKLRASWGKIGNQAIENFATLQTLSGAFPFTLDGSSISSGVGPAALANPDLKWETTTQQNIGIDLGFFGSRLGISADVYHKSTEDLLVEIFIPNYVGMTSALTNIGEVENKGFEFEINAVPVQSGDFTWNTSFNFSKNTNTVIEIGDPDIPDQQLLGGTNGIHTANAAPTRLIQEGYPLGSFYGLKFIGLWQTGEEAEAAVFGNVPGDARYEDTNENGVKDDLQYIGDGNPDFMWGFSNDINYKNFTLSAMIEGVHGQQKNNYSRYFTIGGGPGIFSPTNREVLTNQWSPENPDGEIPSFNASNVNERWSSMFLEDASFIRLRNITLSYTLNNEALPGFLSSLQVYASGANLFTITDYKGLDPESQTTGAGSDVNIGSDNGSIPIAKTYTFGVKIGL